MESTYSACYSTDQIEAGTLENDPLRFICSAHVYEDICSKKLCELCKDYDLSVNATFKLPKCYSQGGSNSSSTRCNSGQEKIHSRRGVDSKEAVTIFS